MNRGYVLLISMCLLVITLLDAIIVAKIFYPTNIWDRLIYWHVSLIILSATIGVLLSILFKSIMPLVIIIVYFIFQTEDLIFMIITTTLGWEPKPWMNPTYEWFWLDGTISNIISNLLGFERTVTIGVIVSAIIGGIIIATLLTERLTRRLSLGG